MGWWSRYRARRDRRRELDDAREERALERLRRSDDAGGIERIASIAEALGSALGRTFEIESKLLADMGGFLGVLQEASARKAAAVLGSRGGRASQAKKKKRLAAPQCPLCADPMRRDVTTEMVDFHRKHGDSGNGASAPDELN